MKRTVTSLALASLVVSTVAFAQPAANQKHAEWATKVRKANFTLLGHNMGPLGGMLKGKVPFNAEVVQEKATNINHLANMIADTSKVDTSKFNVETEALNGIWTEQDDYAEKIKALVMASERVSKIALTGSEAEVKKAMGQIGKACGSCHDSYKKD
ncbi:cytochrome c [Thalassotalea sp. LPB0316]|uniref:c-type cytochrome n=1 Tax=Thalassotalea sp. LPB0316 TaxID=2769490 RepID=UPI00186719AF|nr:cytochrome c [Thalassotalea sp. LPB0316]QOL24568.1 cytochrome c [Thalassotalea sp. LPB0316]